VATEKLGALDVPAPAAAADKALGDPALDIIASWAMAIINAYGTTAWRSLYPAPSVPVKSIVTNSPDEGGVNRNALPSLFVWRLQTGPIVRIADSWRVRDSVVALDWFPQFEPDQVRRKRRSNFINAVQATLASGIRRDRDPAWTIVGDTDTRAATEGSSLSKWLVSMSLEVGALSVQKWKGVVVDGADEMPYARIQLHMREKAEADTTRFALLAGINGNIVTQDFPAAGALTLVAAQFNT
jgi:hypothetical protein